MPLKFKFIFITLVFLLVFSACSPHKQITPTSTKPNSTVTPTPLPAKPTTTATTTPIPATEAPAPALSSLQMLNAKDGWAFSTSGQLLHTEDGGLTWIDRSPPGFQISLFSGSFLDTQTAWLPVYLQESNRVGLFHSDNGGQTWSEYPYGPTSGLHFIDSLNGWAVSGDVGAGNVYYSLAQTHDGGKTWAPIPVKPQEPEEGLPPGTIHLCNICNDAFYYDPHRMVIVYGDMGSMEPGGSVSMEVSFDMGNTWQKQKLPLPQGEADALVASNPPTFFDDKEGLLPVHLSKMSPDGSYSEQKMVFYTTQDGGKTWSLLPGGLDAVSLFTPIQVDSSQDVFVVGEKTLYASHDRARTWQKVASDLDFTTTDTRSVSAIDFIDASTGWVLIMENDTTSLYMTANGGIHWTLITPLLARSSPPTISIDTSIPTPTLIPTQTLEPTPTPNVVYDPQVQADRIQFAPYATWVDLNGVISANTTKKFVLSAMQGQVMSVSIQQGPVFSIEVTGADKKILSNALYPHPFWRGTLPSKEDYFITVKSQAAGPFTLRIAINPPGEATQNFAFYDSNYSVALSYTDEFASMIWQLPFSNKGTPLVTLAFIDPSYYYPTTNLNEAALELTASSDPGIVSTCLQPSLNSNEAISGQETIGGYTFIRSESTGAAAGNFYDQIFYRTVWQNQCFEVIFLIHSSNIGNYPPGTVVEFDRDGLLNKFESVLATFIAKYGMLPTKE